MRTRKKMRWRGKKTNRRKKTAKMTQQRRTRTRILKRQRSKQNKLRQVRCPRKKLKEWVQRVLKLRKKSRQKKFKKWNLKSRRRMVFTQNPLLLLLRDQ